MIGYINIVKKQIRKYISEGKQLVDVMWLFIKNYKIEDYNKCLKCAKQRKQKQSQTHTRIFNKESIIK